MEPGRTASEASALLHLKQGALISPLINIPSSSELAWNNAVLMSAFYTMSGHITDK